MWHSKLLENVTRANTLDLWPSALSHAAFLWNHLPKQDSGISSLIDGQVISCPYFRKRLRFGCPTFFQNFSCNDNLDMASFLYLLIHVLAMLYDNFLCFWMNSSTSCVRSRGMSMARSLQIAVIQIQIWRLAYPVYAQSISYAVGLVRFHNCPKK